MSNVIECLVIDYTKGLIIDNKFENELRFARMNNKLKNEFLKESCIDINNKSFSLSEVIRCFVSSIPQIQQNITPDSYICFREIPLILTNLRNRGIIAKLYTENDLEIQKSEISSILLIANRCNSFISLSNIVKLIKKNFEGLPIIVTGEVVKKNSSNTGDIVRLIKSLGINYYIENEYDFSSLINVINYIKGIAKIEDIYNTYCATPNNYFYQYHACEEIEINNQIVDWRLVENICDGFVSTRLSFSCPFACRFCIHPQKFKIHNLMSLDSINEELKNINSLPNIKTVYFEDDLLNIPTKRFKSMLKSLIKNQYNFKWFGYIRCQYLDEETVKLMKESNCIGVYLGIESGNQDVLDIMDKKVAIAEYRAGVGLLKEYGIMTIASFIVGFPTETEDTINDTIKFINELQFDFVIPLLWYCSKNSPIMKESKKYQIKGDGYEWSHSSMTSAEAIMYIKLFSENLIDSICVPYSNFSYLGIIKLLDKGIALDTIKTLISRFNYIRKEKYADLNAMLDCLEFTKREIFPN